MNKKYTGLNVRKTTKYRMLKIRQWVGFDGDRKQESFDHMVNRLIDSVYGEDEEVE